jgi:ribonuclease P protein component
VAAASAPAPKAAIPRLKRRAEFLRVAGAGRKFVAPGLILQVLRRDGANLPFSGASAPPPGGAGEPLGDRPRVGYTASRKVGIAVARNRARRRLRAAVAEIMPGHAAPGHDYVLVARAATLTRPYSALVEDLKMALRRLGVFREPVVGAGLAGRSPE